MKKSTRYLKKFLIIFWKIDGYLKSSEYIKVFYTFKHLKCLFL